MEEDSIKRLGKKIGLLATIAALGVVGATGFILAAGNGSDMVMATPTPSYTCASVHFGMDDGTSTGYICSYGATLAKGTENKALIEGLASGIGIESFKVAKDSAAAGQLLVSGGKYTASKEDHYAEHTHGVKLGSSSSGATLVVTFSSNVIGCDVYAVGWNDADNSISVNGAESIPVPKNASVAGTMAPDSINAEYSKYHFDFDEADTIEIVTARRLIIGDIALRVKA